MADPKRKFTDIALPLFAQRGMDGVSLAEVGQALGLSKQAVLYHFKTKRALHDAVMEGVSQRLRDMLRRVARAQVPDIERVGLLIDALYAHLRTHRDDACLLSGQMGARTGTDKALDLKGFLNGLTDVLQAHPAAQDLPEARIRAAAVQLLGAICLFATSEGVLAEIWEEDGLEPVSAVFLPVLKEAWGAA